MEAVWQQLETEVAARNTVIETLREEMPRASLLRPSRGRAN
jgi:hypothetical protein